MGAFSVSFLEEPGRDDEWFQFCGNAFGGGGELAEYFRASWNADPSRDKNRVLTARDEQGALLGSLTILTREMRLCRRTVLAGGIATVCTRPDQQGKGIASRLLREAIACMAERGDEISLLGTAIPDYYRRFGWEPIASRRWEWSPDRSTARLPRPSRPPDARDWESIRRLYEAELQKNRRNGMLLRKTTEDWTVWLVRKGCRWMVREDEAGIRSYCAAMLEDDVLDIREFGCRAGAEQDFSDLIAAFGGDGAVWSRAVCCAGFPAPAGAAAGRLDGLMFRLMRPVELDGKILNQTQELVRYLEECDIPFSFSENDSF